MHCRSYYVENPNKVCQFRLAINVYEARRLVGVGKDPSIRVALKCDDIKKTKSKRGSISPKFNQVSYCRHSVLLQCH